MIGALFTTFPADGWRWKMRLMLTQLPTELELKLELSLAKRIDLKQAKEDLWKLRNKEKKNTPKETEHQKTLKRIRELGEKAEKIADILREERRKEKEEKERQEKIKQEKLTKEQKRQEKIEKAKTLSEKWALFRLVTEIIDENSTKWEKERKEREKIRQETLESWDKKTRFEKIKYIKEKRNQEKTPPTENETWRVWRKEIPTILENKNVVRENQSTFCTKIEGGGRGITEEISPEIPDPLKTQNVSHEKKQSQKSNNSSTTPENVQNNTTRNNKTKITEYFGHSVKNNPVSQFSQSPSKPSQIQES